MYLLKETKRIRQKSSHLNYLTIKTNIHMEQTMHINVCIPVTITHVKENRKTETVFLCGHDVTVYILYCPFYDVYTILN